MFYIDLFTALDRAKVRYVIVGGLALNLHGVERATMDVDLALALDDNNLRAAVDAFRTLHLKPIAPVALDEIANPLRLLEWKRDKHMLAFGLQSTLAPGPTVDLLIDPPIPFADLALRAVVKQVGAVAIPVVSIDDLIALKRVAAREIDRSDIEALEQIKLLGLDR
ncbi:MAG: nucleotidyl transferase AbiEii/AbiGii toxin family protein [Burkholderiales bacterium]|jgi:hypothetical protein